MFKSQKEKARGRGRARHAHLAVTRNVIHELVSAAKVESHRTAMTARTEGHGTGFVSSLAGPHYPSFVHKSKAC